ncbi:MAG TPA: glycosyltransferase family 4 protein [Polyangia bacterium]|jgi:glycosyltransferase involved in cell wall biosynthesis
MTVVFFVQGQVVPAARARGFAVVKALQRAGVHCEVRVPNPSVYGDTRLPFPFNRLRPLYVPLAALSRYRHVRALGADDIVFFQRPMLELPTLALERLAARGRRCVFDFDDAIFHNWATRNKFQELIALSDHVIAGNRNLAEAAAAPAKTTIIPTTVDTDRYRPLPTRNTRGRDVVVGWTGMSVNYHQLAYAAAGLSRALAKTGAKLLVISDRPPPAALAALRPTFVRWRAETEIEDLAAIDVGIMPLPDNPYERGKCAYKLIQYMALGRPGVASPVGANNDVVMPGKDGFLPASDDEWEQSIVNLVEDPALRAEMGQRARARVEEGYSLQAVVPRYLDVLRSVGWSAVDT